MGNDTIDFFNKDGKTTRILSDNKFSWNIRSFLNEQASDQNLDEEKFEQLINTNAQNKQTVEDTMGQEYLLPDGTPIYKFFKRNPYGG